jgi:hypothetical protein
MDRHTVSAGRAGPRELTFSCQLVDVLPSVAAGCTLQPDQKKGGSSGVSAITVRWPDSPRCASSLPVAHSRKVLLWPIPNQPLRSFRR